MLWIKNPKELKSRVSRNMEKELILLPFDASRVEKEAKKMDWKKIKKGFDPFAETPISTMGMAKEKVSLL